MPSHHWLKRRSTAVIFSLCILANLSGCAVSYVDEEGRHIVVGLVYMSMGGIENDQRHAGDKVEVTNIGVLVTGGALQSGLSIGYNKEITMHLKNDILLLNENTGEEARDEN